MDILKAKEKEVDGKDTSLFMVFLAALVAQDKDLCGAAERILQKESELQVEDSGNSTNAA